MKTGRPNQYSEKKKMVAFRLRPDLAKWLREQPESQSVLIENALIKAYEIPEKMEPELSTDALNAFKARILRGESDDCDMTLTCQLIDARLEEVNGE